MSEVNSIGFELRRLGRYPAIDLGIDEQTKDLIHLLSSFATHMDTVKAEQLCCVKGAGAEPKKSPARPKPMIDDTFDTLHGDSIERIFDRSLFSAKPGLY